MVEYKIGDMITLKSLEECRRTYHWASRMDQYAGRTMTLRRIFFSGGWATFDEAHDGNINGDGYWRFSLDAIAEGGDVCIDISVQEEAEA